VKPIHRIDFWEGWTMTPETVTAGRYRIGDLARLAGPAVPTLRAWEARYPGLLRPSRTAGRHRIYDDVDLAAVRAMQQLVAAGHTVYAAAARIVEHRDQGRSPLEVPEVIDGPAARSPAPVEGQTWWASNATEEVGALRAAHEATRAFLRATTVREVVAAVMRFVDEIGGTVRPAADGGTTPLPLDISLGVDDPVLADAPEGSPARRRLEALLPTLIEDARLAAGRLRAEQARATASGSPTRPSG
jgi:DNA-binding transcriptional MerR regulator